MKWTIGNRTFDLERRALIMGILNVTPDSFSDGAQFRNPDEAVQRALALAGEGADVIDVGGESTRPGAVHVPVDEELSRVIPVIEMLRNRTTALISVDTSKSEVARAAVAAGADIINDVTAFRGDDAMASVAADSGSGVVLMHMQGTPGTMQAAPHYADVVAEVVAFLRERLEFAVAAGVATERVALDPGVGFGKTQEQNLELLRRLEALAEAGRPVVFGASRKSFLGRIGDSRGDVVSERRWPTVALTSYAIEMGARILRVHDAGINAQAARMTEAIMNVG